MLLLHRLTPFVLGLVILVAMIFTSLHPLSALWTLPIMLLVVSLLVGRLADWRWRQKDFWGLIATPLLFVATATVLFISADSGTVRLAIALTTSFLTYFYEEHLFHFLHLPAGYQAYGLQNVSGVISILTIFYLMASAYATLSFVRLPLLLIIVVVFVLTFLASAAALWMAKVPRERAVVYAFGAAVIFTELFVAGAALPTPFMTNGAFLAVLYYMYVGLGRAHIQARLHGRVIRRYLGIGLIMLAALLLTAKWI